MNQPSADNPTPAATAPAGRAAPKRKRYPHFSALSELVSDLNAQAAPPDPYSRPLQMPQMPGGAKPEMALDDAHGGYPWGTFLNSGVPGGVFSLQWPGYPFLSMLAQISEYRQPVVTTAKEMTRKWIELKTQGGGNKIEKIKALKQAFEEFGIRRLLRRACEHDGFFGVGHISVIIKGHEDNTEEPMVIDSKAIEKGSLKAFRNVEPVWVTPLSWNAEDPNDPWFYKPQSWMVLSRRTHASRLMQIISREVPDILKPAYNFGGISLSQLIRPYVDRWLKTVTSVNKLISNFSIITLQTQMAAMLQDDKTGASLRRRVEQFNRTRDNQGLFLLDVKETLNAINVALSGLETLQQQSLEHVAYPTHEPLVVLTGVTPSGLHASSEGEIEVWHDWINSEQQDNLRPALKWIISILQLHLFGDVDDAITFDFVSLKQLMGEALSRVKKTQSEMDQVYMDAGVISAEEVRARLAADPDSGYINLDPDNLPEPPDEGEEGPPDDDGHEHKEESDREKEGDFEDEGGANDMAMDAAHRNHGSRNRGARDRERLNAPLNQSRGQKMESGSGRDIDARLRRLAKRRGESFDIQEYGCEHPRGVSRAIDALSELTEGAFDAASCTPEYAAWHADCALMGDAPRKSKPNAKAQELIRDLGEHAGARAAQAVIAWGRHEKEAREAGNEPGAKAFAVRRKEFGAALKSMGLPAPKVDIGKAPAKKAATPPKPPKKSNPAAKAAAEAISRMRALNSRPIPAPKPAATVNPQSAEQKRKATWAKSVVEAAERRKHGTSLADDPEPLLGLTPAELSNAKGGNIDPALMRKLEELAAGEGIGLRRVPKKKAPTKTVTPGASQAAAKERKKRREGEGAPTYRAPAPSGGELAARARHPSRAATPIGAPPAPKPTPAHTAPKWKKAERIAQGNLEAAHKAFRSHATPENRRALTAAKARLSEAQAMLGVPPGERVKVDAKPRRVTAMDILGGDEWKEGDPRAENGEFGSGGGAPGKASKKRARAASSTKTESSPGHAPGKMTMARFEEALKHVPKEKDGSVDFGKLSAHLEDVPKEDLHRFVMSNAAEEPQKKGGKKKQPEKEISGGGRKLGGLIGSALAKLIGRVATFGDQAALDAREFVRGGDPKNKGRFSAAPGGPAAKKKAPKKTASAEPKPAVPKKTSAKKAATTKPAEGRTGATGRAPSAIPGPEEMESLKQHGQKMGAAAVEQRKQRDAAIKSDLQKRGIKEDPEFLFDVATILGNTGATPEEAVERVLKHWKKMGQKVPMQPSAKPAQKEKRPGKAKSGSAASADPLVGKLAEQMSALSGIGEFSDIQGPEKVREVLEEKLPGIDPTPEQWKAAFKAVGLKAPPESAQWRTPMKAFAAHADLNRRMTAAQSETVNEYTHTSGYLNRTLQAGKPVTNEHVLEQMRELDSVLTDPANALPEAATVYSGISGFHGAELARAKDGDLIPCPVYVSASREPTMAESFGNAGVRNMGTANEEKEVHVMHIRLPKGYSQGRSIEDVSSHDYEMEVLLGRGQVFRKVEQRERVSGGPGNRSRVREYVLEPVIPKAPQSAKRKRAPKKKVAK